MTENFTIMAIIAYFSIVVLQSFMIYLLVDQVNALREYVYIIQQNAISLSDDINRLNETLDIIEEEIDKDIEKVVQ